MKLTVFPAIALFLLAGCNTEQKQVKAGSAYDPMTVKEEVNQMLHSYLKAGEDSGVKAELPYLDTTADFFWVPPGFSSYIGIDSVRSIFGAYPDLSASRSQTWEYLNIYPIDRDHAHYTGRIAIQQTDSAGGKSARTYLETGLVVRRSTGWKLLGGQTQAVPLFTPD